MKRFFSCAIGMIILLTQICIVANAQNVFVTLNGIDVYTVGNSDVTKVNSSNILYDGTTYVPLRAVSEMLAKTVNYDENTSSVHITNEKPSRISLTTENDPRSTVSINGRSFKKYQDLAYLIKHSWFAEGLFGLSITLGCNDYGYEPYFIVTNKMPDNTPIYDIRIWGYNVGKGKDWDFIATPKNAVNNLTQKNEEKTLDNVQGIHNIMEELENGIIVTNVRFRYNLDEDTQILGTYDFENETLEIKTFYLIWEDTKVAPFKYDVLKDRDYLISAPLIKSEETIDCTFDSIYVYVNGTYVDAPNILYNGRTYVPLRAISEALGVEVTWDEDTNSVYLGMAVAMTDSNNAVIEDNNTTTQVITKKVDEKSGVSAKHILDNPQYLIDLTGIRFDVENNVVGNPTISATNCTKDKVITEVAVKMQNYTTNKYVFGDGVGVMWGNEKYGMMLPDLPEYSLYSRKSAYVVIPGLNSVKQFETDDIYITEISITYLNDIVEKRKGMVDYLVEETFKYDLTKNDIVGVSLGVKNNSVR